MKLNNVSASKYNCYQECPYRFQLQYVYKLMQPESDAFFIGKKYHQSVEEFHKGIHQDIIIEKLKSEMLKDSTKVTIDNFALVRRMFELYVKYPLNYETLKTEAWFNFKLTRLPIPVVGIVDRIVSDGIIEYKTSSFDYTDENTKGIQTDIYSSFFFLVYKTLPIVRYYVMNKKKIKQLDYKPQLIEIKKTKKDIDSLLDKLLIFYNNVKAEKFNPTPGKQCLWCSFKENCKYGKKTIK
jgi:hypothetical protein